MADKATLIQQLPPVASKSTGSKPAQNGTKAVTQQSTAAKTGAATSSEVQTGPEVTISSFQAATYGSFILSFVLAGFGAVILFRQGIKKLDQHYGLSAKLLAGMFCLLCLHGFVASIRYNSYLRDETDTLPLSITFMVWILVGALVGYVTNRLLKADRDLSLLDVAVDSTSYVTILGFLTIAVSQDVGPNTALILAVLALILCTVPMARFFVAYKALKSRNRELGKASQKRLLYSLVLFPLSLPLLGVLYIFGALNPDVILFCHNIIAAAFLVMISFAVLTTKVGNRAAEAAGTSTSDNTESTAPQAIPTAPAMDPLVEELLAEEARLQSEAAQISEPKVAFEPATEPVSSPPKTPPPHTHKELPKPRLVSEKTATAPIQPPKKPGIPAPRKPAVPQEETPTPPPGAPPSIKAPAKPKKRF